MKLEMPYQYWFQIDHQSHNDRKADKRNNIRIRRSNKLLTAVQLPVVVNLNPRSIYNKAAEFKTMMEQLEVGVCTMSESWDRDYTN